MQVSKKQEESLFGYVRSWVLFPFNLWLWTVTIPLRIFLYIAFGDFWKWSKNGQLPSKPAEVKITNGKIISQSETFLRSYQVSNTAQTSSRRLHVGPRLPQQQERYPTYISTEVLAEKPTEKPAEQDQHIQFEKSPSFFTIDTFETEDSGAGNSEQERSAVSKSERSVKLNQSSDDSQKIHGFFQVTNQVNDHHSQARKIQVNKEKTPQKQENKREFSKISQPSKVAKTSESNSESKPIEKTEEVSKPQISEEQLREKEQIIAHLNQQIAELEEREKKAVQEKLDIESKFENESLHWKEDNEAVTQEKAHLRELADQRGKETFDLKQKICELKSQLHSHGDYKLDEQKEIKSVWKSPHHEADYTKMVAEQQYEQTHTKTFAEVLESNNSAQSEQINSVGAN